MSRSRGVVSPSGDSAPPPDAADTPAAGLIPPDGEFGTKRAF